MRPHFGFAFATSSTVAACETVTSSMTPSAPMRMPASSSPDMSIGYCIASDVVSSSSTPLRCARCTAPWASTPVSTSEASVPSTATVVVRFHPCARYSETSMIAAEPTIATAIGERPSSTAGTTNSSTTANVRPRLTSERRPFQRPKATTASANAITSAHRALERSWSMMWYCCSLTESGV